MKRRKVKVNFGNLLLVIFVLGLFAYGGFYVYKNFLSDDSSNSNSSIKDNNNVSKVNKKLKDLGY